MILFTSKFLEAIAAVAVAAARLQIAEFSELAQIALGCSGSETKMTDDGFSGKFVFVGHIFENTDQFLGQSGLYRPFSALKLIYRPFSLK